MECLKRNDGLLKRFIVPPVDLRLVLTVFRASSIVSRFQGTSLTLMTDDHPFALYLAESGKFAYLVRGTTAIADIQTAVLDF